MTLNRKHKIFIGAAALAAAAGGGVAVAASQDTSRDAESKAVIDDADLGQTQAWAWRERAA